MTGISGQAREEAERRWPGGLPNERALILYGARRRAFIAGAEWAASLSPEPSEAWLKGFMAASEAYTAYIARQGINLPCIKAANPYAARTAREAGDK